MQNLISRVYDIFERSIYFIQIDAFYILPIIGSIQLILTGFILKHPSLKYTGFFLFLTLFIISPLVKLIPNLGSDAFSEFQDLDFSEVYFYIKTLNFFAGWSIKHYILWFFVSIAYVISILIIFLLSKKVYLLNFNNLNYFIIFILIFLPTFLNIHKVSELYKTSIKDKDKLSENIKYDLEKINIKTKKNNELSVVLYLGEATTRLHWSIYNYFRPTNINLEKFNKKNSLILYDKVYSTHTHTSPSLLDALTINSKNNTKENLKSIYEIERYPLIDLLNKESIKTILYSTQAKSGSWNLASSLIFKNADKKFYSSKYNLGNANYLNKEKPFDHEFLNEFINELKNNNELKNFFVFHSYAGHGNYKKNIPKNYHKKIDNFYSKYDNRAIFGKFYKSNQKNFLENYDSAMKYISDNIVFALEAISKDNKPIIFIYTPDHGESPLTGRAHDSSRYTWEMSSVPFLIFFNDVAKNKYPELFNNINHRSQLKNRELLSNLPSLILEIFGIEIFNSKNEISPVSKCKFGDGNCFKDYHMIRKQSDHYSVVNLTYPYIKKKKYKHNTDRATTFANINNYLLKNNLNKQICSHRTHTIARIIRFNEILNCMEMDITIQNDYLDVRRPLDESNNLKFKDLIKIQDNKKNIIWLDIKNIDNEKKCLKLNNILKDYSANNNNFFLEFPAHIIDNFDQLKRCILKIKSQNFLMAYHIPTDIDSKCKREKEFDYSILNSCKYLNDLFKKIYESSLFTDITFDFKNYETLKNSEYLSKFILNTWHIPDDKIVSIENKKFRLLMPYNDELNHY